MTSPTPASNREVIVVRPEPEVLTGPSLPSFVGLSDRTAAATGLSMQLVIVPPGAIAPPHFHPEHETGVYILKGSVEVRYGSELQHSCMCEAGDFVFTPPGVVHQPRNLSNTDPVLIVAARNDASEEERTIVHEAMRSPE